MKSLSFVFLTLLLNVSTAQASSCSAPCTYRYGTVLATLRYPDYLSPNASDDFKAYCRTMNGGPAFTTSYPWQREHSPDNVIMYCARQIHADDPVNGYGANEYEARQDLRKSCLGRKLALKDINTQDRFGISPGDDFAIDDPNVGTINCN
jgi:hypothetical protein